jgi:hypothetical protein
MCMVVVDVVIRDIVIKGPNVCKSKTPRDVQDKGHTVT